MQKILLEAIYYVKEIGIIKTILLVYQIDTCPVYFNFQYKVDILIINFPQMPTSSKYIIFRKKHLNVSENILISTTVRFSLIDSWERRCWKWKET